ncbi:MAG: Putative kinase involved in propanediol utilization [Desulfotomaculum sp. 46_296]|nr:MAG: Putative kinase involved in propanediol utilization [Desulfotomaculum sp. 46_296]HAU32411.1 kinase [Desulfotomaculum sp.]
MGILKSAYLGYSLVYAHHGEILQGVFEEKTGHLCRALITLPCNIFRAEAKFQYNTSKKLLVNPEWKNKARTAAELTLAYLDAQVCGNLEICSNIPLTIGLGSSTSDVTATIKSIVDAFKRKLTSKIISHLSVKAEIASDPIMFDESSVLFAHRKGIVIEDFGMLLPPMDIVGFNSDPLSPGIETLTLPPIRYTWQEILSFRSLLGLIRTAILKQDVNLVGKVATISARINQKYLPKPKFSEIEKVVEKTGAVGLQVAHSGTVVGIIFDSTERCEIKEGKIKYCKSLLEELGFKNSWHYYLNN